MDWLDLLPILWPPDMKRSLENTLMLGKIEGKRRRGCQRTEWLDSIINHWCEPLSMIQWMWIWANSRRWRKAGEPGVLQSMGSQRVQYNSATENSTNHFTNLLLSLPTTTFLLFASMSSNFFFILRSSMDRGTWQATVHWVTKSRPRLKQLCITNTMQGLPFSAHHCCLDLAFFYLLQKTPHRNVGQLLQPCWVWLTRQCSAQSCPV